MLHGWLLHDYRLPQGCIPLWQLRAADFTEKTLYDKEFSALPQAEPLTRRIAVCEKQQTETLPYRLVSTESAAGTQTLQIQFEAPKGRYTLLLDVLETVASDLCILTLNGREIGAAAIPYAGNIDENGRTEPIKTHYLPQDFAEAEAIAERYHNKERYQKLTARLRVFRYEVPLVCAMGGTQILELKNAKARLNDTMLTYVGDGFRPLQLTLTKGYTAKRELEKIWEKHPGRSLVDLWGWMSMTSFEHPAGAVTKPARQALRGVMESYPWGANNFEFLPVNADGVALDLSGESAWQGQTHYRQSQDATWTGEEVEKLLTLAHEHGMLCEFFIYCLHGAGFLATDMPFQEKINFLEKIMKRYGSCGSKGQVDGVITEAWYPVDGPRYTNALWRHNPSSFLLSSHNDGSQYDIINAGYSPAVHHYSAHWPSFDAQHTGYDHSYSAVGYPLEFYQKPEGTIYAYLQACGQTRHPRKNFPVAQQMPAYGITNRTVSPDWILAQTHGFALRRLQNADDPVAMALCWEADEETMAPEEARRYIYAASQDPICLAAAARLGDTGEGGELSLKRAVKTDFSLDNTRIRPRHAYPADTCFAQNRFLQLLLVPRHDYTVVQLDLSETATFYNTGAVASLGNGYALTRFEDNRFLESETEILESAGPVCVVRQKSEMGSGFVQFSNTVTHTVYSEVPAIVTEIQRRIRPGQQQKIDTYFDISRYDSVNGTPIKPGVSLQTTELTYRFADSTGVLPTIYLFFAPSNQETVQVQCIGGEALYFRQDLCGAHSLKVICALEMGPFSHLSGEEMLRRVGQTPQAVTLQQEETELGTDTAGPKCVCVKNSDNQPYMVRENGWWHFKGATPSQQHPGQDYLRLMASAGQPAAIRRGGWLTGGMRPAYGCQNILAFSNLSQTEKGARCTVRCAPPNPMLAAPGIDFCRPIAAAWLNGNPWQYFYENTVRLPAQQQEALVEVEYGEFVLPSLIKTYATVTATQWQEQVLSLRVKDPEWVRQADHTPYTACIAHKGWKLQNVQNGTVLQAGEESSLISFRPGEVKLKFTKNTTDLEKEQTK